ncbi:MAG TPA: hypothetical protein GX526_04510 [Thermoanaerobacterales bacterium]|nr:hypothetical protein [Thermoanaerobacterales bacterium]
MVKSTVIILHICGYKKELINYAEELKQELQGKGIIVITTTQNSKLDSNILKALNTKMMLILTDSQTTTSPDVVFYYPLPENRKSSKMIALMLKEISNSPTKIAFGVYSKWRQLFKLDFFKLLSNEIIPTVLIEIRNIKIATDLKEISKGWILSSLEKILEDDSYCTEIETHKTEILDLADSKMKSNDVEEKGESHDLLINEGNEEDFDLTIEISEGENENLDTSIKDDIVTPEKSIIQEPEKMKEEKLPPKKGPRKRWGKVINPLNPPYDGPIHQFRKKPETKSQTKTTISCRCSSNEKRFSIPPNKY